MPDGLVDWFSELTSGGDSKLPGLMLAEVKDNMDLTGQGRVQVILLGYPDVEPWARVASPFAGDGYGLYAMPQTGDQVVVGFERGDAMEPIVLGGLWSLAAMPPAGIPQTDPDAKRVLKTPKGHVVELDDLEQTITITTSSEQSVSLGPKEIEVSAGQGAATITISTAGEVTISGSTKVSVKAPSISLEAQGALKLSGASVSVQATGTCAVKGGTVTIN